MFELMLLGNLHEKPCYGYELKQRMYQMKPNNNKIYPLLNRLDVMGYVRSETVQQCDRPNKKVYALTEEGERYFLEKLMDFDEDAAMNREEFELRILYADMLPKEALLRVLDKREKALQLMDDNIPVNRLTPPGEGARRLMETMAVFRELELQFIQELRVLFSK